MGARVLISTAVCGDEDVLPTLEAVVRLRSDGEVDGIVLDDTREPQQGAAEVASECRDRGVSYFRAPNRLGPTGTANLALVASRPYDYVIVSSPAVLMPPNLVRGLVSVAESDPGLAAVVPWSSWVPFCPLPNGDPDAFLADQETVDWISGVLEQTFSPGTGLDLPSATGRCILLASRAIDQVGLLDPALDIDAALAEWSRRAAASGRRSVLAPAAFVHWPATPSSGRPEPEPDPSDPAQAEQIAEFSRSGAAERLAADATVRILWEAARRWGYRIEPPVPGPAPADDHVVRFFPRPNPPQLSAEFRGFAATIPSRAENPLEAVEGFLEEQPLPPSLPAAPPPRPGPVPRVAQDSGEPAPEELYLDMMKRCLTRYGFGESRAMSQKKSRLPNVERRLRQALATRGISLARRLPFDPTLRTIGGDWPLEAETMIGLQRLDNLHACIADVLARGVPGDLIETGVWRGGATIFMRAALKAYGDQDRVVWVADSFQGLPKPDPERFPADSGDQLWAYPQLAVSVEHVKENFTRYGLLDDRVRFLIGWFKDTLPAAPIERLAVLRADSDLYQSTRETLDNLYPKLSVGGYVIIDDYGAVPACKQAVDDFRAERGIDEELRTIDWAGVFWQRLR